MVALGQHTFNFLCYITYYTAASSNESESQQEQYRVPSFQGNR